MAYKRLDESIPPQTELLRNVLYFNGENAYINCGNDTSLAITGDLSIEAWIYPKNISKGRQGVVSKDYYREFELIMNSDSSVTFYHGNGSYEAFKSLNLIENRWNYIAITRNIEGKLLSFFQDGTLYDDKTFSKTPTASSKPVIIGKRANTNYVFEGIIAEIRIYNRTLSALEILKHSKGVYGNNTGLKLYIPTNEGSGSTVNDLSGNGNNGTIYGASWQKEVIYSLTHNEGYKYNLVRGSTSLNEQSNYATWLPKNDEFELVVHNLLPSCTYYATVNNQEVGYFTTDSNGYAKVYISQNGVNTTPTPKYALITLNSTPDGAVIKIDGEDTNLLTPETFLLEPGTYTISLSKAGYTDFERTINAVAGDTKTYNWTLSVAPTPTPRLIEIEVTRAKVTGRVDINNSRIPASIVTEHDTEFRIRVVNTGTAYAKYRVILQFLGPNTYSFTSEWSDVIDPGKYKSIYLTVNLPDSAVPEGEDSAIYTLESILDAEKVTPTPTPTPSPSPSPSPSPTPSP